MDNAPAVATELELETIAISDLHPHPRNYRGHPEDQLEHIANSLREHGVYRNVVIARDDTILAGHGVVAAARKLGLEHIPVVRLDIEPDSPQALRVLTGDNEMARLAEVDDRTLTELLREIKDNDGLLGTGFDEAMLANLVFVTRPESEIPDFNAAAHWAGMPEYEITSELKVTIHFRDEGDRQSFAKLIGAQFSKKTTSAWWPEMPRDDPQSVRFED